GDRFLVVGPGPLVVREVVGHETQAVQRARLAVLVALRPAEREHLFVVTAGGRVVVLRVRQSARPAQGLDPPQRRGGRRRRPRPAAAPPLASCISRAYSRTVSRNR